MNRMFLSVLKAISANGFLVFFVTCFWLKSTLQHISITGDVNYFFFSLLVFSACSVTLALCVIFSRRIRWFPDCICFFVFSFFVLAFSDVSPLLSAIFMLSAWMFGFGINKFFSNSKKYALSILSVNCLFCFSVFYVVFSESLEGVDSDRSVDVSDGSVIKNLEKEEFSVIDFYYGSGDDKQRPYYNASVRLKSPKVDARKIVKNWQGFSGWYRSQYWGIDVKALPLNAHVWMPDTSGSGSFPLVIIVHGHHSMSDYSEDGYAYIAKKLASRGYIVVSLDQNFLGKSWAELMGTSTLQRDISTRAWLALEHLSLLHQWNSDTASLLYKKIDIDNISLIGHSRGGEAVAVAAYLNDLSELPNNTSVKLNYGYQIKNVIAIAPSDGQYVSKGKPAQLKDINYLTLHGSHDADVTRFDGLRQLQRVTFSEGTQGLKAAWFIGYANHGNFNSNWGDNDKESSFIQRYNIGSLISGEEQRRVAFAAISSFLDYSVKGNTARIDFIKRPQEYFSGVDIVSQFGGGSDHVLLDFEESIDASKHGKFKIDFKDFYVSKNIPVKAKWRKIGSKALYLEWKEGHPQLVISAIQKTETRPKTKLVFSAYTMLDEPLEFAVHVVDRSGEAVSFPVSDVSLVPIGTRAALQKEDVIMNRVNVQYVMQTFEFDLASYRSQNHRFNETDVESVRFVFSAERVGNIVLDNIGFSE